MSDGAMHFGVYGKQRGWVRAGFSQGIPDKADSDGFIEIPKQMELERDTVFFPDMSLHSKTY